MIREIIKDPNVLVKSKNFDVKTNRDTMIKMVQDMDDTLDSNKDMIFLCSNEVGFEERAIDIRFTDDTVIMFNPSIRKRDELTLVRELDRINGKEYIIPRFSNIEIIYQDCLGAIKGNLVKGPVATVICQAMDVLNGVMTSDYGLEIIPEFDAATPEEQKEVIEAYVNTIKESFAKLDKELSDNEDTKDAWGAAKFIRATADGEVEFDNSGDTLSNRKKKKIKELTKTINSNKNRFKFWDKLKGDK